MNEKYELTDEIKYVAGYELYRIRALRDFSDVKAGDFGGYIWKEDNLSHEGNCWVYDDAKVYGYAEVSENAKLSKYTHVNGYAKVYGNARLSGVIYIYGHSHVYGDSHVGRYIQVGDYAHVCGNAHVSIAYSARICGDIKIDHGIWLHHTKIDGKIYMVSSTLEKVLLE